MGDGGKNLADLGFADWPTKSFNEFVEWLRQALGGAAEDSLKSLSARDLYAWTETGPFTSEDLVERLSRFCEIPFVGEIGGDEVEFKTLSKPYCQAKLIVPIKSTGARQTVVLSNPFDWELLEDLERTLPRGRQLALLLASPAVLEKALEWGEDLKGPAEEAPPSDSEVILEFSSDTDRGHRVYDPAKDPGKDQAVARLAMGLLQKMVAENAGHLFIEPLGKEAGARAEIEGRSYELQGFSMDAGKMLVARFKALSGMDLAKRRTPQKGSFQVRLQDRVIKLLVSTSPSAAFENVTVRVLNPSAQAAPLHQLGFSPDQAQSLRALATQSKGLILFVGPLGSGKTTTMASLLADVANPDRRVMTVEDPIEHLIPFAHQQEVTPDRGVPTLLRNAIRQQPDILFLSEIRDLMSAQMCMEFVEGGRLVLASMNSSNAGTVIFRLERLGLRRSDVADLVIGVVAQRLLRRLCPDCRAVRDLTDEERDLLKTFTLSPPDPVAQPSGCSSCQGSGYLGQEGIFEVIPVGPRMSALIRDGRPIAELRDFAQARGDLLVSDHGIQKLRSLTFSLEDVYRNVLLEEAALDSEADGEELGVVVSQSGEEEAGLEGSGSPRANILVAEDEEGTLFLLENILSQAGYRVVTASDGGEALLQLGAEPIDLVLSDIHMPSLDGLKLLEILNQHRMDLPVILLTGEPSPDVEARGLEMGVAAYMRKPIQRDKLLGHIAEALGESLT